VLVGSGTVLADDPDLTCRLPGAALAPALRVVADGRLRTPHGSRLVAMARQHPTVIVTVPGHPPAALAPYQEAGAEVIKVPRGQEGLSLPALLAALAQRGVTRVLAEGGAGIAAGLLRGGLVDRLAWFHAPGVMGGDGLPAAYALPVGLLSAMPRFRRVGARPIGPDWLTEFEPERD
jgi:diaminohydroxyphosphoribosylaminopyrimidine deaminase/5-amino-6-(5-phosphoribosylamino)uracil reductase